MKLVWEPVRRIGHMYGLTWDPWFLGLCKRHDPGVLYEGRM